MAYTPRKPFERLDHGRLSMKQTANHKGCMLSNTVEWYHHGYWPLQQMEAHDGCSPIKQDVRYDHGWLLMKQKKTDHVGSTE